MLQLCVLILNLLQLLDRMVQILGPELHPVGL